MAAHRTLMIVLLASVSTAAWAEEAPQFPGPSPEHALLERFVGEWETTGECDAGPDSEPMENLGKATGRLMGGRWVVTKMEMDAGGEAVTAVQTIGYDPFKKKYVGTWIDSMQNHLFVYEGAYDEATQTLTLDTTGPNLMTDGATTSFRDTYRFVSDDEIVSESSAVNPDGEWETFMTGRFTRKP